MTRSLTGDWTQDLPHSKHNLLVMLILFASFRADYELFQVELSKNYGTNEWREDLRKVMMKAGLENNSTVFLFSDTQVWLSWIHSSFTSLTSFCTFCALYCWRIPLQYQGSHDQGKRCFFQGQGKIMEFWNWSGKNDFLAKVMEMSGNFMMKGHWSYNYSHLVTKG